MPGTGPQLVDQGEHRPGCGETFHTSMGCLARVIPTSAWLPGVGNHPDFGAMQHAVSKRKNNTVAMTTGNSTVTGGDNPKLRKRKMPGTKSGRTETTGENELQKPLAENLDRDGGSARRG